MEKEKQLCVDILDEQELEKNFSQKFTSKQTAIILKEIPNIDKLECKRKLSERNIDKDMNVISHTHIYIYNLLLIKILT